MLKRLTFNGIIYFIGNIVTGLISIAIISPMTHYLDSSDYGFFSSFQFIISVVACLTSLGFESLILSRWAALDFNGRRALISACCQVSGITSLALTFAMIMASRTIPFQILFGELCDIWVLFTLCAFFTNITGFYQLICLAENRPSSYVAVQVVSSCAVPVTFMLLPSTYGLPRTRLVTCFVALQFCLAAHALWKIWRNYGTLKFVCWFESCELMRMSLSIIPHSVSVVTSGKIDQFAVLREFGEKSSGHLALASQLSSVVASAAAAMNRAYLAFVCSSSIMRSRSALLKSLSLGMALSLSLIVIAASVSFNAELIVQVIAPKSYVAASLLIPSVCFRIAVQSVTSLLSSIPTAIECGWILSVSSVCNSVATMGLCWPLMQKFGPVGAVYAGSAGGMLCLVFTIVLTLRSLLKHEFEQVG